MKRIGRRGCMVGLGLALVLLAGCETNAAKLTRFNDQMALSNRKLGMAAWDLRELIFPLSRGTPVDVDSVKSSYEAIRSLLAEIRKEQAKFKDEIQSLPAAVEMHKAYGEYLDAVERIVEQDYATIVRWVSVPNLAPLDKWAKIQGEMGKIQDRERPDFVKLQEAQTKFSNDASMRLVEKR